MLLAPGKWRGVGSFRLTTDSNTVAFAAEFTLQELEQGLDVNIDVENVTGDSTNYKAWIAPDETGMYTVSVVGNGIELEGSAKLDSAPHLALLRNESADSTLSVAVFETREAFGVRGFYTKSRDMFTFELALRSYRELATEQSDNVIAFR